YTRLQKLDELLKAVYGDNSNPTRTSFKNKWRNPKWAGHKYIRKQGTGSGTRYQYLKTMKNRIKNL
ncbi:MAG: hypothetical protein ABIA63_06025, partial [bacterium]